MAHEHEMHSQGHSAHGPGYASPQEAMKAEPEKVLYTIALYDGTGNEEPDYLATVDVDPNSPTYSKVISRTVMPYVGEDRKSTRLNSSHVKISYAVFCLKKK